MESVLVVLLAAQAARLTWTAFTPLTPIGEPVAARSGGAPPPPADLSVLERYAFSTASAATLAGPTPATLEAQPPPAPAISGYQLHGVRGSIGGDGGAAIIAGPDGQQASYRRGATVGPGVTLAAIGREAVTLSGAGGSVRLALGGGPPTPIASTAPSGPTNAPRSGPVDPAALGFGVGVQPAPSNGAPPAPPPPPDVNGGPG